jgi:hypothetical protein
MQYWWICLKLPNTGRFVCTNVVSILNWCNISFMSVKDILKHLLLFYSVCPLLTYNFVNMMSTREIQSLEERSWSFLPLPLYPCYMVQLLESVLIHPHNWNLVSLSSLLTSHSLSPDSLAVLVVFLSFPHSVLLALQKCINHWNLLGGKYVVYLQ